MLFLSPDATPSISFMEIISLTFKTSSPVSQYFIQLVIAPLAQQAALIVKVDVCQPVFNGFHGMAVAFFPRCLMPVKQVLHKGGGQAILVSAVDRPNAVTFSFCKHTFSFTPRRGHGNNHPRPCTPGSIRIWNTCCSEDVRPLFGSQGSRFGHYPLEDIAELLHIRIEKRENAVILLSSNPEPSE